MAEKLFGSLNRLSIYNSLGQLVREEEVDFKENAIKINTSDLMEGVYFLGIRSGDFKIVSKRFVIAR